MRTYHPKDLKEAVKIVNAWRDRPDDLRVHDDYEGWQIRDGLDAYSNVDFVKLAILNGHPIPGNFKHWGHRIKKGHKDWQTIAHFAAEQKHPFPADFEGWSLLDSKGVPVIYTFMLHTECVPDGFSRWDIQILDGLMIAHAYPMIALRPFPSSFVGWELRDNEGYTVAHRAVSAAHFLGLPEMMSFPDDPDIWRLRKGKEGQGRTVMHVAANCGMKIPETLPLDLWHSHDSEGATPISLARRNGHAHLVSQYEALKLSENVQMRDPQIAGISRSSMSAYRLTRKPP